jgi:redox-sensitive bicupin YhaK (pirin superfamily)
MITPRPSGERGHTQLSWLDSRHTFSFDRYQDARHMGFRTLRVINEDRVQPGQGFHTHPHRDMEILTYVLAGALEHRDSLGSGSVIRPGEIQTMSAGIGVTHSEFNHSPSEPVHFLQMWVLPDTLGVAPRYQQRAFAEEELRNRLRLVASREGRQGSVGIYQDTDLFVARLGAGATVEHVLRPGRHAWVQVARGAVSLKGVELVAGDGAAVSREAALVLTAAQAAEVLLFDLA